MTAGQIVDNLIDIVSKNGNMMLNVGLRADGSLPETFFMVTYKKDGRGLHDMIAGTNVIEEVKK